MRKEVCEWKEVVRARVCMDRVVLFSIDYISCGPSAVSQSLAGMQLVFLPHPCNLPIRLTFAQSEKVLTFLPGL
jgi:hypothetical protein